MFPWIPWFKAEPFDVAGVTVQPFGLLVFFGTIIAMLVGGRRAIRTGIARDDYVSFLAFTIPTGYFCGNVYNLLSYYPEQVWADPLLLFKPWYSQGSFGGFFGAILGGFLWKWRHKRKMLPVLDACAFGLPVFWAFGRTGCFVTHDHPGEVTSFFLAVRDYEYGEPPFLPRHDLGFYEVIWSVSCVALFHYWQRKERPPGFFMAWLAILYAPIRFCLDFLRVDDRTYGGLTPGHFAAILSLVLGLGVLRVAYREAAKTGDNRLGQTRN